MNRFIMNRLEDKINNEIEELKVKIEKLEYEIKNNSITLATSQKIVELEGLKGELKAYKYTLTLLNYLEN